MIQYERRQQLFNYLKEHKSATIAELSGVLYISEASVRRDVAALEQDGLVQRKYGGVVLSDFENSVVPLALRDPVNAARKDCIARQAAELVEDGMTIMLDASSTARRIMGFLQEKKNLKIITNNIRIFENCPADVTVYCVGGRYLRENAALVGGRAEEFVREMRADILFFSSQGIDEQGVISDASEEETALRRAMLQSAKHRYFLCDSTKRGKRYTFVVCAAEDIDGVISDDGETD